MQAVTTIGLDIAKSVFQVHGTDAAGEVVIRRQLKHRHVLSFFQKLPPCPRIWRGIVRGCAEYVLLRADRPCTRDTPCPSRQ